MICLLFWVQGGALRLRAMDGPLLLLAVGPALGALVTRNGLLQTVLGTRHALHPMSIWSQFSESKGGNGARSATVPTAAPL